MSWRSTRTRALMAAVLFWGWPGLAAAGEQTGNFDQRLMFDPGTLADGRFLDGADTASSRRPVQAPGASSHVAIQGTDGVKLPDLGIEPLPVDVPRLVDRSVPSNPVSSVVRSDVKGLDPRLSLGNFSVGVETDTPVSPRIPFAGDMNETGYDTSYDPKHPHPLPFIGFSAKSILQ